LGRCVVWCKREDALDLTDVTPEEQSELFLVLRDLKNKKGDEKGILTRLV